MIIKKSEYITSGVDFKSFLNDKPNAFFLGRSNVGKSSLINALTGRKNLARTSSNPGKTRTVNFFLINDSFYLVDLPGYGYAKVGKQTKESFGPMIDKYITHDSDYPKIVFLLVDYKVGPTKDDIEMCNYLKKKNLRMFVVGTKMDKLKQSELVKNKKMILSLLEIDNDHLFLTSSENKRGINDILNKIEEELGLF